MLIKIHKTYREVIAVCDTELVGKTFEEGIKILDVKTSFFNGEEISEEKFIELAQDRIKEDATFNIVGEKSIAAALKAGIITQEGIKTVQGIPFALILL